MFGVTNPLMQEKRITKIKIFHIFMITWIEEHMYLIVIPTYFSFVNNLSLTK